eukprot:COSAG02_NODE_128_length_34833_cov_44.465221_33_plen_246_part_00
MCQHQLLNGQLPYIRRVLPRLFHAPTSPTMDSTHRQTSVMPSTTSSGLTMPILVRPSEVPKICTASTARQPRNTATLKPYRHSLTTTLHMPGASSWLPQRPPRAVPWPRSHRADHYLGISPHLRSIGGQRSCYPSHYSPCCVLYTQLSNNRRCLRPTAARGHTAYTHCDSPAQRRRDGSTGTSLIAPLQREASCTSICTVPGRGQQLPNATAVCARRYTGVTTFRARASHPTARAGRQPRAQTVA